MDYNLGNKKGCLIGNWQEENALKDYCGHYRTAGPEEPKLAQSYKRCLEHTVRIQPTESDTSNRKDYFAPKNAQSDQMHLVYKPDAMVGARQRLMMQKLQASARVTTQAPVAPREWETMHSTMYTQPIVEDNYKETLGAKRMRNQDNAPIKGRDQTFLLEAGIVAPHICLEAPDAKQAAQDSALGAQGVPVTVYSDNPSAFYMSNPAQGHNPFGKVSDFSIPIQEFTKRREKDI